MKAYKGFKKKIQCDPTGYNLFQYEIEEECETDQADAATQGKWAHAATHGEWAMASVKGTNSIACALGINGAAKGALGCWIAIAEYDGNFNVIGGRFAMVDGEKIKEDTYYTIKNGEFVEVQDE